jgi:membrane protein
MSQLKERATKITQRPAIAHLLRANKRFSDRLGNQFGAAITYFSVLAMVPIIMFAFSVTGFVLVVVSPQLLDNVMAQVNSALEGMDKGTQDSLRQLIEGFLKNYAAVGIVGLLTAIYSGAGWMGNLKDAVRGQWRPSFDLQVKKENIVVKTLTNLAILIALLIMVAVTFALASVSTALSDDIIGWLGLDQIGWLGPVLRLVPILVSIGTGWLIFMFLYLVLPETREPWKAVRRGALIGAIGLGILQYGAGFLISWFAGNPTAALFGPVIVLMLFFNLFARLILFVAAWIGTYDHPAEPEYLNELEDADDESEDSAQAEKSTERSQTEDADDGWIRSTDRQSDARGEWTSTPGLVRQEVAEKSVKAGTGAGYIVGALTGSGIGAALAVLLNKINKSRADRRARRR